MARLAPCRPRPRPRIQPNEPTHDERFPRPGHAVDAPPANGQPSSDKPSNGSGSGKRRVILGVIALVFILAGIGWYLLHLFVFSLRETTDDAYVNGNQVTLSSQIDGTVIAILADDTQRVDVGQVLVKLDPTDTQVNLAKAKSALANAVREVRQQTASASQYDAAIAVRKLDLSRAEADLKRRPAAARRQGDCAGGSRACARGRRQRQGGA